MGAPAKFNVVKLSEIASFKTGRLNSNAAVEGGNTLFSHAQKRHLGPTLGHSIVNVCY